MTSINLGNQCFETCLWIPLTMAKSLLLNSALLEIRIPALAFNCSYACSALNKIRNPLTVCGIRLHLRIPLKFCGIQTTSYIRLLRKPRHNKCADKSYVTLICTRNPQKFCKWNPFTFWNMFKD